MTSQSPDEAPGLTAADILQRMATVYATCASYRDEGRVEVTFTRTEKPRVVTKIVRTAFVRPHRFRFEYEQDGERQLIVWRRGDEVRSWWIVSGRTRKSRSLDLPLAGATGISNGAAHAVPSMLLPSEVSGYRLNELGAPRRLEPAACAGVDCLRVAGEGAVGPRTVWIDPHTFLVRRIDTELASYIKVMTTYEPSVDASIPEELLAFDPPRKSKR